MRDAPNVNFLGCQMIICHQEFLFCKFLIHTRIWNELFVRHSHSGLEFVDIGALNLFGYVVRAGAKLKKFLKM